MGMKFGKYVLEKQLAIGGMAEVFLAKQHGPAGFSKVLAIKRILPDFADDSTFVEMFLDEARTAAQLTHPNIVQIYELGESDDSYYIAMEYIRGASVAKVIRRLREHDLEFPLHYAAKIVADVCAGLDYAHNFTDHDGHPLNLVHRDISPDNVLVSLTGSVKMIDFGIAKAVTNTGETQAGAVKGKFSYMSPEQIKGLPLDGRSDLFSLGIVLYELTTLQKPFGDDADLMTVSAIVHDPPAPPGELLPHYPPELERILTRALSKERAERYQTAAEMQRALEQFIHGRGAFINNRDIGSYVSHLLRGTEEDVEALREVGSGVADKLTGASLGAGETEGDESGETTRVAQPTPIVSEDEIRAAIASVDPERVESGVASSTVSVPDAVDEKEEEDEDEREDDSALIPLADHDEDEGLHHGGGVGKWIALVLLLLVAGAAGAYYVWAFVLDPGPLPPTSTEFRSQSEAPTPASPSPVAIDARGVTGAPESEASVPEEGEVSDADSGLRERRVPTDSAPPERLPVENIAAEGTPETEKVVPKRGRVSVRSTPSMKVFVAGKLEGSTPIDIDLATGTHSIELRSTGGARRLHEIRVRPGQTKHLEEHLIRGELVFADLEPGVRVLVDGKPIGTTPMAPAPVWEGDHQVVLERSDGETRSRTVSINRQNKRYTIKTNW